MAPERAPLLITPRWPAPAHVRAASTTRRGGRSGGGYRGFNLGERCGDDAGAVAANRALLVRVAGLPREPRWLRQVHGPRVVAADTPGEDPSADASVADAPGAVCAVLGADCLPVVLCDRAGTRVACAHAGWRGLAGGVLEATVARIGLPGEQLVAWLGPAIGRDAYEIGGEVRDALLAGQPPAAGEGFARSPRGRWLADLYHLAAVRLGTLGVSSVHGGGHCTFSEPDLFFSYRRDGTTGRMATLAWLERPDRGRR